MRPLPLASWHQQHAAQLTPDGEVASYGDPAREYRAVSEAAGLFDASLRDRLLVTGNDRIDFLQGLCTNDLEKLPIGGCQETAFITPKGKLVAEARVTKLEDALLFDGEPGRAAALAELLGKYRIHEDCDWRDASEDLVQLELWGPKAAEVLGEPLAEGQGGAVAVGEGAVLAVGTPFGAALFVPTDGAEAVLEALRAKVEQAGGCLVGRQAVEPQRILLGLGRYGIDWDENTNPLEAGLDRALDYKKGCYVGQEVVAKATYIGHVNRRLVRLEWTGAPVAVNTALLGARSPGRVTSCAQVPGTERTVALGYVRRDGAAAGSKHRVGEDGPEAVVLGYPYRSKEKPV